MSIEKTSLKKALLEAKEIEKSALENARKILEETISPKIEEVVKETIKEIEKEKLEEGVTLEVAPDATLKVAVSSEGNTTVSVEETKSEEESTDKNNISKSEEEMKNTENKEEIYEIEGVNEAEAAIEAPAENAPVEVPSETVSNPFEAINQKLDDILNKIETHEEEEAKHGESEGEIEIVDDEAPVAEAPAEVAPEEAKTEEAYVTENMEDEIYEFDESPAVTENSEEETYAMDENLEEIEIVDEDMEEKKSDEEEGLEEMGGVSYSTERRAGRREKYLAPKMQGHHAPVAPLSQKALTESENKIKAQYESTIDELKQENEGLKETVKEYKESFVVLRKQINEVQTFNAKLAYANTLFTKGGLTNEEKIKIAEEFDKVETVEEAKKLYNNLITEMNISKESKNPSVEKIKSVRPAVTAPTSSAQTLYESDEVKRMKKLAGIAKSDKK